MMKRERKFWFISEHATNRRKNIEDYNVNKTQLLVRFTTKGGANSKVTTQTRACTSWNSKSTPGLGLILSLGAGFFDSIFWVMNRVHIVLDYTWKYVILWVGSRIPWWIVSNIEISLPTHHHSSRSLWVFSDGLSIHGWRCDIGNDECFDPERDVGSALYQATWYHLHRISKLTVVQ